MSMEIIKGQKKGVEEHLAIRFFKIIAGFYKCYRKLKAHYFFKGENDLRYPPYLDY